MLYGDPDEPDLRGCGVALALGLILGAILCVLAEAVALALGRLRDAL